MSEICTRASVRSSPVISDSCLHAHWPTILGHGGRGIPGLSCCVSGPSSSETHVPYVSRACEALVMPSALPEPSERSTSRSQSCSFSRYSESTTCIAMSSASSLRNAADSSRRARGRKPASTRSKVNAT